MTSPEGSPPALQPPDGPKFVSINCDANLILSDAHNCPSDAKLERNGPIQWNAPICDQFNPHTSRKFMLSNEKHTGTTYIYSLACTSLVFPSAGSVINAQSQREANFRPPIRR